MFLWIVYAFVLPFSLAYPNLVLIPILFLFLGLKKFKQIHFYWKSSFLLFIASVFWITASGLILDGFMDTFKLLSKFYFLIGIFFLAKSINTNNLPILFSFISGTFVQFSISLYGIVTFYLNNKFLSLALGESVNEILHGERPYIGFILSLSVFFSLYIIRKLKKNWLYIWVILACVFVFFISARLATGMCIMILIHHLYVVLKQYKIYFLVGSLAILMLIIAGFAINENFQRRFHIEEDVKSSFTKFKDYEPRFIIWDCALELSNRMNPLLGMGNYKTIKTELIDCYLSKIPASKTSKKNYYQEKAFNTHNQFLSFLLLGGFISCIALILFFAVSIVKSNGTLYSFTLILFLIFFVFENVLYRQLGIHLFGFLLGLLSLNLSNKKSKLKSEGLKN